MFEFMMTLAVIALIFIIATAAVTLAAGTLVKMRGKLSSRAMESTLKLSPTEPTLSTRVPIPDSQMRICARNTPWP